MDFFALLLGSQAIFLQVEVAKDFMAVWLSYPSRWLALIYAEINVQNLICLIAPET